jgi:hypothetical protein
VLVKGLTPSVANAAIAQLTDEREVTQRTLATTYPEGALSEETWRDTLLPPERRFEALALSLAEDIAILEINPDGSDRNALMSIAAPSRWAPEEKIGCSFITTHIPVPNIEKTLAVAPKLQQMLLERGPFVRFAWGISTTSALDMHPSVAEPPYAGGDAWLRVERQVIRRIPEHPAYIFTIRVIIEPLSSVRQNPTDAAALASALRSMDEKSRVYKSVDGHVEALCAYLNEKA